MHSQPGLKTSRSRLYCTNCYIFQPTAKFVERFEVQQWHCCRFRPSEMQHYVTAWAGPNILKHHLVSLTKPHPWLAITSGHLTAHLTCTCITHAFFLLVAILLGLLDTKDEGTMIQQHTGHHLPSNAASHPRELEYSTASATFNSPLPIFNKSLPTKSSINSCSFL